MKNKFIFPFTFLSLIYISCYCQFTQNSKYGYDITTTTPIKPLRVLLAFVEFDQTGAPGANLYSPSKHDGGCNNDNITRVVLNTLDNTTTNTCNSPNHYTYFNGGGTQTTTLVAGNTYTLQVSFGSDNNQYFGAWIDFDGNGYYSPTTEFLGSSGNAGANGTISISFTVPNVPTIQTVNGLTHLRIVGGDNSIVISSRYASTGNSYFGETQDFDITLSGGNSSRCDPINNQCWPPGGLPFQPNDYFDDVASNTPTAYFSKYLYEASLGQFKVIGDYLTNVIHLPCSSIASIFGGSLFTYPGYHTLIQAIDQQFQLYGTAHGHPISDFDNYDFGPGQHGSIKNPLPNQGIDFLIVCYGNSYYNNYCGAGHGCHGGAFQTSPPTYISTNYTVDAGCDFFMCGTPIAKDFIIEEFFHALFGSDHFHSGTGAGKHTFPFRPQNWGITTQLGGAGMSNMVCGWDRWWLGWEDDLDNDYIECTNPNTTTKVNSDLNIISNQQTTSNGEYILRDFGLTGDVMRIKLPHINWQSIDDQKNQYLWIENHQQKTTYDHSVKYMRTQTACMACTPICGTDWKAGLYAYYQVGKDQIDNSNIPDIYSVNNNTYFSGPNDLGSWLFPITAEGNYDQAYGPIVNWNINDPCVCSLCWAKS